MSKEFSQPAFPVPGLHHDEDFNGMSLRDYFAAKALPAIMSGDMLHAASETAMNLGMRPEQGIAKAAYEMADAMLEARSKP